MIKKQKYLQLIEFANYDLSLQNLTIRQIFQKINAIASQIYLFIKNILYNFIKMKSLKNNFYDCQCNLFAKKNNLITLDKNKISIKDKQALANKLTNRHLTQSKIKTYKKIVISKKITNPTQKQDLISMPITTEPIVQNSPNNIFRSQRSHFSSNFKTLLTVPVFQNYQIRSPNLTSNPVFTYYDYKRIETLPQSNKIEIFQNNSKETNELTRNASLKDLKHWQNAKTTGTLKRSDSQIISLSKKKSQFLEDMENNHNNYILNQNNQNNGLQQKQHYQKLTGLHAKSIVSSGKRSQNNSEISEVIQSLIIRNTNNKSNFYFNLQQDQ